MTEDERRSAFAEAFLKQARSDWGVYRVLLDTPDIPLCHSLHYLQMACEKVSKAYRLRDTASPVDALLSKHVGFSKFVSAFLKSPRMKRRYAGKDAQLMAFERTAVALARAIERLAPAEADRRGPARLRRGRDGVIASSSRRPNPPSTLRSDRSRAGEVTAAA